MNDNPDVGATRARHDNPFLNTRQAGHYLHLTPRYLERLRGSGGGPVFRRHGRFVFYHIEDLDAWSRASAGTQVRHD